MDSDTVLPSELAYRSSLLPPSEFEAGLQPCDTPVALIGPSGAGKTSLALHHEQTKRKFGNDRMFVRCDKLQVSRDHFLSKLSQVVGADIENPQGLASLRPYLSSKPIFLVIDNAETILDPKKRRGGDVPCGRRAPPIRKHLRPHHITHLDNTPCEQKDVPTLPRDAEPRIFCSIRGIQTASPVIESTLEN